jgi:hypothetical protein
LHKEYGLLVVSAVWFGESWRLGLNIVSIFEVEEYPKQETDNFRLL